MLRGAAAMAAPVARALRRPAADLVRDRGESLALGATLAPGASIGTHAGHPAGSG